MAQVHVTYRFQGGMWLAGDANFYTGGRTTIGGKESLDLQRNSRIGATFSKALTRHHADPRVGEQGRLHDGRRGLHLASPSATTTCGRSVGFPMRCKGRHR